MGPIWQLVDSSAIGGIERHIEMLSRGLIRVGLDCEVVLYASYGPNPWLEQLKAADVPFRILKGNVTDLRAAMRTAQPAMVHTHGYKAGILGRAVARLSKTPIISTFHSGERGTFPVSLYQTLDEMSAFLAPAIAVSDPIRERLPKGSELVYNFVDMPDKTTDPMRNRYRIGYVGRFSHEKAPDLYCGLADILKQAASFEAVEWHAYGDGPMLDDLTQSAAGVVNFHGLQTDMSAIWPTLDLLVMPSRAEGLPLAALEAMSYGIPVVAPKIGALPDVIKHGETGWLYDPGDLEAAADHIAEWSTLETAQRQQMFEECRDHIATNFSVQSRLKTMLALYNKCGLKLAA